MGGVATPTMKLLIQTVAVLMATPLERCVVLNTSEGKAQASGE